MQYRRPAFTLIELLVVIAIIGILSALVVTQLGNSSIKARNATAQSDIAEMGKAVESFRIDDQASGQVVSNPSGTVDQQGGGRSDFPSLFTGAQSVPALTYAAAVSKTPGPPYVYRYVASGTQAGQTGRQLVQGAVNQPVYALCTTLVAAPTPYFCTTDTAGGGGSQSDQVLAAQGLGNLSAAAANGLVAWYKLDESGTATVASDSSGTGNNGSLANFTFDGTTNGWVDGKYGKGLLLNGSNNYVAVGGNGQNGPNVFTVSTWFKTSTAGGTLIGFCSNSTPNRGNYDRFMYITTTGTITFGVFVNGFNTVTSPLSYADNAWHLASATLSSQGQMLYVDGSLVAQNSSTTSAQNYSGYWFVGADTTAGWPNAGNYYFTGLMDDVHIYNRALSANEVQQLYQGTL